MKKDKTTKESTLAQVAAAEKQSKNNDVATQMQGTPAGQIWNEIKDLSIEMFALPEQVVHMYCNPVIIDPSKLYLLMTSSAVLPSLETAVGKKFNVELADKFVIVTRAVK